MMHTLVTFLAAFLMMPAKIIFPPKAPEKHLTVEKMIQMGAGN